jgi:N-methylhydantoinase B
VSFPYNVRDVSIEWSETETPVLYEARELIPDSGGAGQYRGGLGQELIFRAYAPQVAQDSTLVLSGSAGRMRSAPRGLAGGRDGALARIEVNGEPIEPNSSPEFTFRPGDVVRLALPGGGGHGDPTEREAGAITADIDDGYLSTDGASRDYGYDGA